MGLNLVKISNILNILTQEYAAVKFYHFGWRSDINHNIDNNFDPGQSTGRLYPAVHLAPFETAELPQEEGQQTKFVFNVYFDDLQNYNNDSSGKTLNTIEQWQNLMVIAEAFLRELDRWGQSFPSDLSFYIEELQANSLKFTQDAFGHKDRLLTIYSTITIVAYGECTAALNLDPSNRPDWPPINEDYERRTEFAAVGWDTAGDGTLDTDAIAEYLNGLGGTFRSEQYYKNNKGEVLTTGTAMLRVVAKHPYSGAADIVLGTYSAAMGGNLNALADWVTAYAIYTYFGVTNITGHEEEMQFAKLLYATANNAFNVDAQNICMELTYINGEVVSTNANNSLLLGTEEVEGGFYSPLYIRTYGNYWYVGQFLSEGGSTSGLIEGRTDRFYTGNNATSASDLNYTLAFEFDMELINPILYYIHSRQIKTLATTGRDADGYYTYAVASETTTIINAGTPSPFLPFALLQERLNGKPIVVATRTPATGVLLAYWDGAAWQKIALPTGLDSFSQIRGDFKIVGNKIYCAVAGAFSPYQAGFVILSYTGDPLDTSNWTSVIINNSAAGTPTSGTGATAVIAGTRTIYVDTENVVNGEPTIWACNHVSHVIYKITANQTNPTTAAHWDFIIVIGQIGIAGHNNGTGLAALLTAPRGITGGAGDGLIRFVYSGVSGNLIGEFDPNILEVLDYKGTFGAPSFQNFKEF